MRIFLFATCLIFGLSVQANNADMLQYRKMMGEALNDQRAALKFFEATRNITYSSIALDIGFKAIAEFMLCKHVSNPLTKLSLFRKGRKNLEYAIAKENQNVELRFMRFCTQSESPDFLHYNEKLYEDKLFLISYLKSAHYSSKMDTQLYNVVKLFLAQNKYCTIAEKNQIKLL